MKKLNPKSLFKEHNLRQDLTRKSIAGGMTTLSSQVIQFLLRTATTFVLARILTPADFGLIGMVTVITNFALMFKDAGLSMATVQKESISEVQISTLFWINVIISSSLGICLILFAPFISQFYNRPELSTITILLSFSFIITGLSIQHQALQKRHMMFTALAITKIASQIATLITTVLLAVLGYRYWALVFGSLASAVTNTLFTFYFCPWIPGRMQKGTGVRKMLKFGGHLTGFNFINYFSRNSDNILIGRFIGADSLGLYSKAYQLFTLPITQIRAPINNVAVPALCALIKHPKRYNNYYRTIIFIISTIIMPLVSILLIFSNSIILLMLGKQWIGAVPVFQVLAIVGFFQSSIQAGRGLPLISMGFSRRYFHFGIIQSLVTVTGISIGLNWGIIGVAIGYATGFILLVPFTMKWCLKGSPVTVRDWLHAISSPTIAAILILPCLYWFNNLLLNGLLPQNLSSYLHLRNLLLGSFFSFILYTLILLVLPNGKNYLYSVLKQIKKFRNNSKKL